MNPYTYNNRASKSLQIIHFCPFFLRPSCFWFCEAVPPFLLNRASFSVDELAFYSFFPIPFFHVAKTLFPIKACDPTTTKASQGDTGGNLVTEWETVGVGGYIITTKRSVKANPWETTSANSLVFSRNGVSLNAARNPHWVLTTHSSRWWTFLSGSSQSTRCFPTLPQLNDACRPHQVKLLLIAILPRALLISAILSGNLFCRG